MASSTLAPVKICFNGEIHRFHMNMELGFATLHELFCATFPLDGEAFAVQYTDADGDVVTVANDAEFAAAWESFRLADGSFRTVRFTAVARSKTAAFQETVADPLLKALEKLVETLTAAMEKVKNEDWKRRAQSGVQFTSEAVQSAAKDARASLHLAQQSLQEIPFEQLLKDTTESLKAAAEGISVFAKEVVAEVKKEKVVQDAAEGLKTAAESASAFATNAVEELKKEKLVQDAAEGLKIAAENVAELAKDAVQELKKMELSQHAMAFIASPAPVHPSAGVSEAAVVAAADSDWEQVAEEVAAPAVIVEEVEEEEAEIVEVSEEEKKWAAQLATIRDIFPDVDTTRAVERLEHEGGNVELVLNALMEEM
ncbi:hypothetical protein PybrP1_010115 [[Pythium] brassicae (nom. inval.)]|nr:hypothetical protein PybrP1_010115 [[Pythium] brassicae (nom. inval.)]